MTAIVFLRAMQALFSGPLAPNCSAFPNSSEQKCVVVPVTLLMFADRHRTAIRLQHLQHHRHSDARLLTDERTSPKKLFPEPLTIDDRLDHLHHVCRRVRAAFHAAILCALDRAGHGRSPVSASSLLAFFEAPDAGSLRRSSAFHGCPRSGWSTISPPMASA